MRGLGERGRVGAVTDKFFLFSGAVSGFLAVALGAFGAHGLKERLDAYHLGVFQTGVTYQFFHALVLLVIGLWLRNQGPTLIRGAGHAFLLGTVVFSGSLYTLALTGAKGWGAVTPIGGVAFLAGWVCLAVAALK